jgi:hypothetical protein
LIGDRGALELLTVDFDSHAKADSGIEMDGAVARRVEMKSAVKLIETGRELQATAELVDVAQDGNQRRVRSQAIASGSTSAELAT